MVGRTYLCQAIPAGTARTPARSGGGGPSRHDNLDAMHEYAGDPIAAQRNLW
jgi:hypothetical protein